MKEVTFRKIVICDCLVLLAKVVEIAHAHYFLLGLSFYAGLTETT